MSQPTLTREDIAATVEYLVRLHDADPHTVSFAKVAGPEGEAPR